MTAITKVAWIGLGAMGAPMALAAARAGIRLTAFDVSPASSEAVAPDVAAASSAREAAEGADVVAIMVATGAQLQAVLFGEDGIADVLTPETVVLVMATVGPAAIDQFLEQVALASDTDQIPDAELGQVTLMTLHTAKGLEFPVVFLTGLEDGGFPHSRSFENPQELSEERRLAYVAFTRARHELLLSGSWWRDGKRPRVPSRFLIETLGSGTGHEIDEVSLRLLEEGTHFDANPSAHHPEVGQWPTDPLGSDRGPVEYAARLVHEAAQLGNRRTTRWSEEIDALLAERDRLRASSLAVILPRHLSASQSVRLAQDPLRVARDIRRPVPAEPGTGARRGSAFHAWLEKRFGIPQLVDLDDVPGAADAETGPPVDLVELQRGFERSQWVDRSPIAVECDVETPVAGTILRGRVDAVFAREDGGVDIVDWKTGRQPQQDAAAAAAYQLAVYRVAWSRLHDLPIDKVHASFCYVATGRTISPTVGLSEAELIALIESVPLQGSDEIGSARRVTGVGQRAKNDTTSPPSVESVPAEPGPVTGRPRRRRADPPQDQLSLFDE